MTDLYNQSEPHPGFGHLQLIDYPVILYCIIRIIGKFIIKLVFHLKPSILQLNSDTQYGIFLFSSQHIPTSMLIQHRPLLPPTSSISLFEREPPSVIHHTQHYSDHDRTNNLLNPAIIRFLTRPIDEHITPILSSPRYDQYRKNINRRIVRPEFAGYWVLQHSLKSPKTPSNSDLTIFYIHGGGYFSSQPAHYLLFLLRLAETILEEGVSVSIFALDYSLAPENVFPTQLKEANAAYAYLLAEEQIPEDNIIVAGDSAGGHLALSLLVDRGIGHSSTIDGKAAGKPGGLILLSPWLSLHQEPASFSTNAHMDVMSRTFIRLTARRFLGHDFSAGERHEGFNTNSPLLEFLTPEPEIDWDVVLPSWVWVSAGTNEIFLDSVKLWVAMLKRLLGEPRVVLELGVGKAHVWQWLETMLDEPMKKLFLGREVGDGRDFEATASLGRAIVARVERVQSHHM